MASSTTHLALMNLWYLIMATIYAKCLLGESQLDLAMQFEFCVSQKAIPKKLSIFDNFFTSYDLLSELSNKNIKAKGVVRENRIVNYPLLPANEMSKTMRSTYDYLSDGNI
ncbi:hypothetical protein PR048_006783 [Dryococelus australis]|uniref:PiggyBac transposable element-derived protein domain-containing protein n=1 Tax=Dryococelus australis TaxID=614101 RepID=A0ABQ9IE44_9NEOP|nr:hypothetical protein PR048_006783 [Dryococelus australis]